MAKKGARRLALAVCQKKNALATLIPWASSLLRNSPNFCEATMTRIAQPERGLPAGYRPGLVREKKMLLIGGRPVFDYELITNLAPFWKRTQKHKSARRRNLQELRKCWN
jgi:hypothetical protein